MNKTYESPVVDIVEIEVEKGFAASVGLPNVNDDGQAYGFFSDYE